MARMLWWHGFSVAGTGIAGRVAGPLRTAKEPLATRGTARGRRVQEFSGTVKDALATCSPATAGC
eukprot:4227736-Alexandrium_andersonii.AAC.1